MMQHLACARHLVLLATLMVVGHVGAADEPPATDTARVGKAQLTLLDKDGRCVAWERNSGVKIDMKISAPCRFVREPTDNQGRAQWYTYPKVGHVVLVSGKPLASLPDEYKGTYSATEGCSDQQRALMISPSGVVKPSAMCERPRAGQPKGISCPDRAPDEKIYHTYVLYDLPELRCEP